MRALTTENIKERLVELLNSYEEESDFPEINFNEITIEKCVDSSEEGVFIIKFGRTPHDI